MALPVRSQDDLAGTIAGSGTNGMLPDTQRTFLAANLDNCLVTLDGDHLDTVQSLADGDRLWLTTVDHQHRLAAHHAGQADILRGCRT